MTGEAHFLLWHQTHEEPFRIWTGTASPLPHLLDNFFLDLARIDFAVKGDFKADFSLPSCEGGLDSQIGEVVSASGVGLR
jgi:hypothetical protein